MDFMNINWELVPGQLANFGIKLVIALIIFLIGNAIAKAISKGISGSQGPSTNTVNKAQTVIVR